MRIGAQSTAARLALHCTPLANCSHGPPRRLVASPRGRLRSPPAAGEFTAVTAPCRRFPHSPSHPALAYSRASSRWTRRRLCPVGGAGPRACCTMHMSLPRFMCLTHLNLPETRLLPACCVAAARVAAARQQLRASERGWQQRHQHTVISTYDGFGTR